MSDNKNRDDEIPDSSKYSNSYTGKKIEDVITPTNSSKPIEQHEKLNDLTLQELQADESTKTQENDLKSNLPNSQSLPELKTKDNNIIPRETITKHISFVPQQKPDLKTTKPVSKTVQFLKSIWFLKPDYDPELDVETGQFEKKHFLTKPRYPLPRKIPVEEFAFLNSCCIYLHLIYPIIMIIITATKFDQCPAIPSLPYFMIFNGLLGMLFGLQIMFKANYVSHFYFLMMTVFFFNLITVFTNFEPEYNMFGPRYCDKTFYQFSIVLMAFQSIDMMLILVYICMQMAVY